MPAPADPDREDDSIAWVMIAAAFLRDEMTIRDWQASLPPDQREDRARGVADRLAELAQASGRWEVWAWAVKFLTPAWQAEAGRELWARLSRWSAPMPPVRVDGQKDLARLALRLVSAAPALAATG